jgi:hypothetical protein
MSGIRITWVTEGFELMSRLLCVRRFRPESSLIDKGSERLSDTLYQWFKGVLGEWGLDVTKNMLGSTTDKGPDVKRMSSVVAKKVSCRICDLYWA